MTTQNTACADALMGIFGMKRVNTINHGKTMKERCILMAAGPVRNILAGRQTQDRRPVKPQPDVASRTGVPSDLPDVFKIRRSPIFCEALSAESFCKEFAPHQPGDILRVRERARLIEVNDGSLLVTNINDGPTAKKIRLRYEADGVESDWLPYPARLEALEVGKCIPNGCYKEACRLRVQITSVRVERLQDISEEDAIKEGIIEFSKNQGALHPWYSYDDLPRFSTAKTAFLALWNICYGPESWEANPWVWVTDFKKL